MGALKDLCDKVLEDPEARMAYEEEKKVLVEEIAEWERERRRRGQPQEESTITTRV